MTVKSGQVWADAFVCLDSTGALATPSVGPVGTLYVNGVANAATVTITGTNPYKWSVTLPSLSAGDRVSIYMTATIALVATGNFVTQDQADTKLVSDLNDLEPGALMGLVDDAITSAKFDESTAFPVKSADSGATQIARTGADGDTLKTLSDQIDAVEITATLVSSTASAVSTADVGDLVRLGTTFYVGSTATDPTTVELKIKTPAGVTTTYTYALSQITKSSTGVYYKDISLTESGVWCYKWTGTGVCQAMEEGQFYVRTSEIT